MSEGQNGSISDLAGARTHLPVILCSLLNTSDSYPRHPPFYTLCLLERPSPSTATAFDFDDGPFPIALQSLTCQGWSEFSLCPLCIKLYQRSIKTPCVLMSYGKFHEMVFLDRAEIHQGCPGKGCFSVVFGQCLYHSGC